jgi:hypothetical protein
VGPPSGGKRPGVASRFEFVAPRCSILHRLTPQPSLRDRTGPPYHIGGQTRGEVNHAHSGNVANVPWHTRITTLSAVRCTNEDQNNHTGHIHYDHRRSLVSLCGLLDRDDNLNEATLIRAPQLAGRLSGTGLIQYSFSTTRSGWVNPKTGIPVPAPPQRAIIFKSSTTIRKGSRSDLQVRMGGRTPRSPRPPIGPLMRQCAGVSWANADWQGNCHLWPVDRGASAAAHVGYCGWGRTTFARCLPWFNQAPQAPPTLQTPWREFHALPPEAAEAAKMKKPQRHYRNRCAGAQSTGETLERGSSLQHQDLCLIQLSSRSTNVRHRAETFGSVKTAHPLILREWLPCPLLPWFSIVPHAGEAESRQFRRMSVRLRGILTLWCTRFLPTLR